MEIWNLEHLYKSRDDWRNDAQVLEEDIKKLRDKDILASAEELKKFLRQLSDCYALVERVYIYPRRILDLQDDDSEATQMMNKAIELYNAYLVVESHYKQVLVTNKERVEKLITKDDYWYRYVYIILRKGNHIADAKVLANYNEVFPRVRNRYLKIINEELSFEDVLIDEEEHKITRKNYNKLLDSKDQSDRYKVFSSYMQGYAKKEKEITQLYKEKILNDIALYKSEGYSNLLEKKLFELELNPNTLDHIIDLVNKHIDIMHDYVALKKKVSGLKEFHTYDSGVAITTQNKKKMEFVESVDMVKEALKPLGEEYVSVIDKAIEEGWIDVYPKDHKRSNTSTSICYNGVPYILLNYTKNIIGARDLAHELGHAIHVYYAVKNNGMEYFEFDLFLTEIVSKVNEILFNEYLLKRVTDEDEKLEVLNNIVGSLGNSLFNQMMMTEFEHQVIRHVENNEDIDADYLNRVYFDKMKKYNGDALTIDNLNKYGWMEVTHLIWQDSYYLYQYSIGLSLGTSIALKILMDRSYVEKYKKLLSVGRTMPIADALKLVDIDIDNPNYLDDALNYLNDKIEALKQAIDK